MKLLLVSVGALTGVTVALVLSVYAASEYKNRVKTAGTISYVRLVSSVLSVMGGIFAVGYYTYLTGSSQKEVGLIQAIRSLVGPFIVAFFAGFLVLSAVVFLVFWRKVPPPKRGTWYDLK
jgi:MFS family permease